MGKKKAKNRSNLLDSGRDSVNIDIKNGKLNKYDKVINWNITMAILLIVNLILLHIILANLRRQAVIMERIEEFERRQEQILDTLHSNVQCSFDIAVKVFEKYAA